MCIVNKTKAKSFEAESTDDLGRMINNFLDDNPLITILFTNQSLNKHDVVFTIIYKL